MNSQLLSFSGTLQACPVSSDRDMITDYPDNGYEGFNFISDNDKIINEISDKVSDAVIDIIKEQLQLE